GRGRRAWPGGRKRSPAGRQGRPPPSSRGRPGPGPRGRRGAVASVLIRPEPPRSLVAGGRGRRNLTFVSGRAGDPPWSDEMVAKRLQGESEWPASEAADSLSSPWSP